MTIEAEQRADRHVRLRDRPAARSLVVSFAVVFAAMVCWSLATPVFAGPDEPTHIMKAAALVRGELLGQLSNPPDAYGLVTLPKFFAVDRNIPACYQHKPTIPASSAPNAIALARSPTTPGGIQPCLGVPATCVTNIYNARYPPLYYALVGLPSLLGAGNWVIYMMRWLSAALCALFVSLAVAAVVAWSSSRLLLLGLIVGTTPFAIYLGGIVNPSALEVASAICFWTAGSILVFERNANPPRALIVLLVVAGSVFASMRSISPLWIALAAVVFLGLADRPALARLLRHRAVIVSTAVFLVVVGLSLAWTFNEHAFLVKPPADSTFLVPRSTPLTSILWASFLHNRFYLPTMVGVFGSFDTFSPRLTYVIWYAAFAALMVGALLVARHLQRVVLVGFVAAILVVPVLISSSQAHRYGYTWNGRDTLPFALGLPIVASALYGASASATLHARAVGVVALLTGLAQFAAFFEALRRYTVGTAGPQLGFVEHPEWHPPLGVAPLLALEAIVLVVAGVAVSRTIGRSALASGVEPREPGGARVPR